MIEVEQPQMGATKHSFGVTHHLPGMSTFTAQDSERPYPYPTFATHFWCELVSRYISIYGY